MESCRRAFFRGSRDGPTPFLRSTPAGACSTGEPWLTAVHAGPPSGGAAGKPDGGHGGRRALPAMLFGCALAVAAVVGLALAGASAAAAACAAVLALAALAIGWGFGERGMAALEDEVETRTSELKRALSELEIAQAETVQRLSMAVEFRDEDTGAHIERIGRFSVLLAEHIGMDAEFCERLRHAAPLHDVGKVAIPDAILLKPGPADARGAGDRRDPRRGGPPARPRLLLLDPRHGRDDRAEPPGEVGRQRLPARPEGRGDPDRGPHRRRRRRVRRAHQRPRLPQGLLRRRGDPDDARTARSPLRPGAARRLHGSARTLRPRRPRGTAQRPGGARRVHARDVRDRARTRRRGDGRGRDRDRDRGRHLADHAARRGDRPGAAQARRALRSGRTLRRHRAPRRDDRAPRAGDALPLHDRRHRADARARAARGRQGRRAHARAADGPRPARRRRLPDGSSTPTSTAPACWSSSRPAGPASS